MKYFLILTLSLSFTALAEIVNNTETGVAPTESTEEFNSGIHTPEERLEQQRMEERRLDDLRSDSVDEGLYQTDEIQKEEEIEKEEVERTDSVDDSETVTP